ncbi:septum formation inhibitor Maf [Brachybacterium vulturis]|uniref:Nucleoside triphosphate pyrophosphatase n=1 Tax=Brachybacterium vulturis TaxID=2017484 RepID=A0A291GMJ4_9MICO|nr:nucleoside triphosphate pyrophosphatase [Brachybacterium vulturis]ATG51539.1 septum formation inhibitor Maf [Brachybacterium vulturis]
MSTPEPLRDVDVTDVTDVTDHDPLLLLASASAGRRATLRAARIEHSALPVDLDEEAILARARARAAESGDPQDVLTAADEVLLLAREKALAATARSDGGYVVLGCDSMLELDGEVIGKPLTAQRAVQRWRAMRGRTGILHSGHWLVDDRDPEDGGTGATFGATASCELHFAALSDEEIEAYVATGEPLGVAGGFTLDGIGGPFIEQVQGDPHAVVGLSLPLLRRMLGEIGLGVHELWEDISSDTVDTGPSDPADR